MIKKQMQSPSVLHFCKLQSCFKKRLRVSCFYTLGEGLGIYVPSPSFCRPVNPISIRGADYPHQHTTGPLGFSDLPTALHEEETSDEDEPGMEPIKVANTSPTSATRTSLKKKSKKNMSLRHKAEALLRLASAKSDDKSLSATASHSSTTNSCLPSAASTNVAKV